MAAIRARFIVGAAAALASAYTFAQDFGVLLQSSTELLAQVPAEADRTALAARELGRAMSVAEREAMQTACTAVVAAPGDTAAERRLQRLLTRAIGPVPLEIGRARALERAESLVVPAR